METIMLDDSNRLQVLSPDGKNLTEGEKFEGTGYGSVSFSRYGWYVA
jgi:hypothetical protein